ncbi:hypothetical protein JCM17823_22550 [Halorubrum gandharaense]
MLCGAGWDSKGQPARATGGSPRRASGEAASRLREDGRRKHFLGRRAVRRDALKSAQQVPRPEPAGALEVFAGVLTTQLAYKVPAGALEVFTGTLTPPTT